MAATRFLSISDNAKTPKGRELGFETAVMYMLPGDLSGFEVCPFRSPSCTALCLNTAGRGVFESVQRSRDKKTRLYFEDRPAFMRQLVKELAKFTKKARESDLAPCIRLNGTSDIPFERVQVLPDAWQGPARPEIEAGDHLPAWFKQGDRAPNLMACFPTVQFYDYTKIPKRVFAFLDSELGRVDGRPITGKPWPSNYHLTFSRSETDSNHADCVKVLRLGGNVAAVYHSKPEIETDFPGFGAARVVDGDASDVRFADGGAVVIALSAKGRARYDKTGFAI
jgi:hypothetical protein